MTTTPIPWTVPALLNLATYIEQGVLEVANTKDLASGQSDRFTQAAIDVTAMVRSRIQSVPGYVVSATYDNSGKIGSVPPELMTYTCQLILLAMQAAYPGLGLSKEQQEQFRKAQDFIDGIKTGCDYRPTLPPDPMATSVQQSAPVVVVRVNPRAVTGRSMSGISLGMGAGSHDEAPYQY